MISANAAFYKQFAQMQMQALDRLTVSDDHSALAKELFSASFVKSFDYLETQAKVELGNKLLQRVSFFSKDLHAPLTALAACVACNAGEQTAACQLYSSQLLAEPLDKQTLLDRLSSPVAQRATASMYTKEALAGLLSGVENLVPDLFPTDADKTELLGKFPALIADLERQIISLVDAWAAWLSKSDDDRAVAVNDLNNSLQLLRSTKRIKQFYKLVKEPEELKESFLTSLAVTLREALRKDEDYQLQYHHAVRQLAEQTQAEFFYVEGAGIVMDRWLEKQLVKHSVAIIAKIKDMVGESVVLQAELKSICISCFNDSLELNLPFGGGLEGKLVNFVNTKGAVSEEVQLVRFPRGALQASEAAQILLMFPDLFEVSGIRARYNRAPASHRESVDLVDVLITETLDRIPRTVFAHRPHPQRIRQGVFRFGSRDIVFSTKQGRLVAQPGDTDGVDLIAREYSITPDLIRAPLAGVSVFPPNVSRGAVSFTQSTGMTRRNVDWRDARFLYRLIRAGFKARDEYWKNMWKTFCTSERIPADKQHPKKQSSIDVLQRFLELNLAYAQRKEWARHLLFFVGEPTDLPPDSGSEADEAVVADNARPEDSPFFKTRRCIAHQAGKCHRGSSCGYAHSDAELREGPAFRPPQAQPQPLGPTNPFFKTRMCFAFLEGRCSRLTDCTFAHSQDELAKFTNTSVPPKRERSRSPRARAPPAAPRAQPPPPPKKRSVAIDESDL